MVLGGVPSEDRVQVLLAIKQQETRRVVARLSEFPEIKVCLGVNSEFDLFVSAEAPRMEDLDVLTDEIAEIPGVLRTQTLLVFGRKFDRAYPEVAQWNSDRQP